MISTRWKLASKEEQNLYKELHKKHINYKLEMAEYEHRIAIQTKSKRRHTK